MEFAQSSVAAEITVPVKLHSYVFISSADCHRLAATGLRRCRDMMDEGN